MEFDHVTSADTRSNPLSFGGGILQPAFSSRWPPFVATEFFANNTNAACPISYDRRSGFFLFHLSEFLVLCA